MAQPEKLVLVPFRRPGRLRRFPPSPPIVGRSDEVGRLVGLLREGARLVTILGPPGIGKTSLVVHAAHQLSAWRPAWFCDLARAKTVEDLCSQVATLAGEPVSTPADLGEVLAEQGPLLVVLDNFEQLVDASELILEWVRAAEDVAIVVTSRERLAVDDERVLELGPLRVPDDTVDINDSPAVQLFMERAGDAAGRLDADGRDHVVEIVRQLDGIPLAIELAAVRTRLLPVSELAKRLARGADLLALSKRSPERHQTLARAVAWSWDLLTESERQALLACAAFSGSFSLSLVELVLAELDPSAETLTLLASLRDKSLVHVVGEERLGLYAAIREFVLVRANEVQDIWSELRAAHAKVMASVAASFNRSRVLLATTTTERFPDAHREGDNFSLALETATMSSPSTLRSRQRAELVAALIFLGLLKDDAAAAALADVRHASPAVDKHLAILLDLARQRTFAAMSASRDAVAQMRLVVDSADATAGERAAALVFGGVQLRAEGEVTAAVDVHEQAATLLAGGDAPILAALNTACRGRLACDLRELERAEQLNQESIDACEQLGERWLAALGVGNLAQLEQEEGRFARAEEMLGRAMERFRAAGEPQYEGAYAALCGALYLEWGKHELARHWFEAAQTPLQALAVTVAQVIHHGGWALLEARDRDEAAAHHRLELARRVGARRVGPLVEILVEAYAAAVTLTLEDGDRSALAGRLKELRDGTSSAAMVARHNLDARAALRLWSQALGENVPIADRETAPPALVADAAGLWFEVNGAKRVDLRRRGALSRLVAVLCRHHADQPGRPLSTPTLFEHGWPGESIMVEAAATRVRVAVATLRKLGLRDILVTHADGYLIESTVKCETSGPPFRAS